MVSEYLKLDYLASAAVIVVGAIVSLRVRNRCGALWLPVFALFVVLADPTFYWPQVCIAAMLRELGWWTPVARGPIWSPMWTLLPRLFVILCAWGIWQEARRLPPIRNAPQRPTQHAAG